MTRADSRPRVLITRHAAGADWRLGPCAMPHATSSPGAALDRALERLGQEAKRGVVVIVEPGL